MRNLLLAIGLVCLIAPACKKSKGGDACENSVTILASSNPANGANLPAAPGPDFPLTVNVTSSLAEGATIVVTARTEGSSNTFFSVSRDAAATNTFSITNSPSNVTVLVEITVTSKSCASNVWRSSYRYATK